MLRDWFRGIVIKQVILFVMRQLEKFTENINWDQVKADLEPRIRDLIPGTIADDLVVGWANALIDMVATVLTAKDEIQEILTLLSKGDYNAAWQKLRELILGRFQPTTVAQQFVYDCVDDCKSLSA